MNLLRTRHSPSFAGNLLQIRKPVAYVNPKLQFSSTSAICNTNSFRGFGTIMSSTGPAGTGGLAPGGVRGTVGPPSQVRGHIVWLRGLLEETCGSIFSSHAWTNSGRANRFKGVSEMRAAKEDADSKLEVKYQNAGKNPTLLSKEGALEKLAGVITGCGGMKERGEWKKVKAEQAKEH